MLEIDDGSISKISEASIVLQQFEGRKVMAFSSYTHAFFDQETRIITGDLRWRKFMKECGALVPETYPLIWEMRPPGGNEITFLVPTPDEIFKTSIKTKISMICWWEKVTPELAKDLEGNLLLRDKWVSVRNFIFKRGSERYSQVVVDKLLERLDILQSLYAETFVGAEGKRLSEISEELYQKITRMIFGESVDQFRVPRESYFSSSLGQEAARRSAAGLKDGRMEPLLRTLRLGSSPVFIGREGTIPFSINLRAGQGFLQEQINSKSGQVARITVMDLERIIELLDRGEVAPVGPVFDALMLTGDHDLVIHDGNDYGNPQRTRILLKELSPFRPELPCVRTEYLQLFPDGQNTFAPFRFTARYGLHEEVPSLATLFLWNLKSGFWEEKLERACQTGKTQDVDVSLEVADVN
ncbi:MAG: hypothetical protein Q7S44_00265 [bacterium]|nr:hypothetical protein [bacterium]